MIVLVLNLGHKNIETPEVDAARIEAALKHVPADRLAVAPDCGMKYLQRDLAFGKLKVMVEGARVVRERLGVYAGKSRVETRSYRTAPSANLELPSMERARSVTDNGTFALTKPVV